MIDREAYRVTVRHNLLVSVGPTKLPAGETLPESNLAVGSALARNNLEKGCIDGDYHFASVHDAKDFAALCLEFVRLLLERSQASLTACNFYSEPHWLNPHLPAAGRD